MTMAKIINSLVFLLFFILFQLSSSSAANSVYNVINFGAIADGSSDSTKSFLSAWAAACGSTNPSTIIVPNGNYFLNQANFNGPCKSSVTFRITGTLVAPSNYAKLGSSGLWLAFNQVHGLSIYGGTLDGQGTALWACKAAGKNCPFGASSLTFNAASNVLINGLTLKNSQLYHLVINGCDNVNVQGVKIIAPVHGQGPIAKAQRSIRPGELGLSSSSGWVYSIGSLGKGQNEAGVVNVTVKTAVFTGSQNGLRIKTWARPSTGFVKGVVFKHVFMRNVENPVIIDQNYCPDNENCPNQVSGVKISQVSYSDIQGTSATQVAVKFDCSASNPCKGIELQDVKLTYGNSAAKSSCKNADGTTSGFVVPPSCL
ncbi:hypothetical protein MRB53_004104 [Persea americana]|uniref:Uncharacterized protein n=1 Tax=Persea americana TaxID=3435 RepID=A0ACC2N1B1_PERAE|nr:hypothetical protein MRB53_004104 [Persea americana]